MEAGQLRSAVVMHACHGHRYRPSPGQEQWKQGNALFNDALNIFYYNLYSVRHMVKGPVRKRKQKNCC